MTVDNEYAYEWDLKEVDISQTDIDSPEFSFNDIKFVLNLKKNQGKPNYGGYLKAIDPADSPLTIHFRLEVITKTDNIICKTYQLTFPLSQISTDLGFNNLINPTTISEHILKIKIWTSPYDVEHLFFISEDKVDLYPSSIYTKNGSLVGVKLVKNEDGSKYEVLFVDDNSTISNTQHFQMDIFTRVGNLLMRSFDCQIKFDKSKTPKSSGLYLDAATLREYISRLKCAISYPCPNSWTDLLILMP